MGLGATTQSQKQHTDKPKQERPSSDTIFRILGTVSRVKAKVCDGRIWYCRINTDDTFYFLLKLLHQTRMHSSRMRTVRRSGRRGRGEGGVCPCR